LERSPRAAKPMGRAEIDEFEWVLERIGFYRGVGDIVAAVEPQRSGSA
jgi:hypothetical protein